MDMERYLTVDDLRRAARKRVPKMFFDYVESGSWSGRTWRANEEDFTRIKFRQRVLRDISDRSLATTMLGETVSMPLALAPTGSAGLQYANGEILAARAAEAFGIPFVLSTMSICSLETVATETTKPFWFQLYVMRDRGVVADLISRAKAAGCSALVVTADLQLPGRRHQDIRNGLTVPMRLGPTQLLEIARHPGWTMRYLRSKHRTFGTIARYADGEQILRLGQWAVSQFDQKLSWSDLAQIRDQWDGKLIVKGILDTNDARDAVSVGVDAIVVSNHGGRQLDDAPSSISVLPAIVDAVADKVEIHLDGGVRSGQDILKARCLGAQGVYVGRPFLYGLGAGGQKGVTRLLEILYEDLSVTLALCGERTIEAAGPANLSLQDWGRFR